MPFRYSSEFRHKAVERMLAGEAVKDLAAELGVSDPTLYKWRRQALMPTNAPMSRNAARRGRLLWE